MSKELNCTKGKWTIQDFGDETIEVYVPKVGVVAKCNRRTNEQAEANAQLIASAPALYEALQMVIEDWSDRETVCQITITRARQVLLKAEGK